MKHEEGKPPGIDPERSRRFFLADVERREFLKKAGRVAGGMALAACFGSLASCAGRDTHTAEVSSPVTAPAPPSGSDIAIASGGSPADLARRAVDAIGGMSRFVGEGSFVVVKPNASFLNGLRDATTTDPGVVGEVVAMCRDAGASKVLVIDHVLCGTVEDGFGSGSGIGEAVESNGGKVLGFDAGDRGGGVDAEIPNAQAMRSTSVYPEVLEADLVITVPKAKHHSGTGLTLGMKNFIGVTANMSKIHTHDTHRAIADLNRLVRPGLSVVDATVILTANGPGGPGPTSEPGQVIASSDVVAADSYACTLFGMTARDVPYIVYGQEAGLGEVEFNKLNPARV
jgi:uncharacterized protein (DUF362 family)